MELNRVVVTGIGAITPTGNSTSQFWNALLEGKSGAAPITRFDTTHFKTKFACEVKGFDPLQYLEKKDVRRYDLYSQFAIAAADEAIADAHLISDTLNRDKVGVIWCSGIGGITSLQDELIQYAQNDRIPRFSPFLVPKMIVDLASGHISIRHGLRGLNFCVVSACASSTNGLIDAFNYLRLGKANAIVCCNNRRMACFCEVSAESASQFFLVVFINRASYDQKSTRATIIQEVVAVIEFC